MKMDRPPRISVIIHFLDAARYLGDAIQSVFWQTFPSWELILVDGGSSDESSVIAQDYLRRDPHRVRYVRHDGPGKLGIYSSRIWGAREARAPVLAHLDSDDEWHPRLLERHYTLHQAHFTSRPGLAYCPMVYWWEEPDQAFDSYVQPIPAPGLYEPPNLLMEFVADGYSRTPGNSAVMTSREIILAASELIGVADEGAVEDQFLWSFVSLRYPICVSPEPLTRYRQWPGSTCSRTVSSGAHGSLRERHLRWLEGYLSREYTGPHQATLLSACQAAAGQAA